jgi:hypothetical protein
MNQNLKKILTAINAIDLIPPYSGLNQTDLERVTFARNKLLNIIFQQGYEINYNTRRLVKSQSPHDLLPEKKEDYEK